MSRVPTGGWSSRCQHIWSPVDISSSEYHGIVDIMEPIYSYIQYIHGPCSYYYALTPDIHILVVIAAVLTLIMMHWWPWMS